MSLEQTAIYKEGNGDTVYMINTAKCAILQDPTKMNFVQNLLRCHELNHDLLPWSHMVGQPGKQYLAAPFGGSFDSKVIRRTPEPSRCSPPNNSEMKIKFELGLLPCDDFRFSMDTSSLPVFYRTDRNTVTVPRSCCRVAAPINVLISNVAVLKPSPYNFIAATGVYAQTPVHSFFTYFIT